MKRVPTIAAVAAALSFFSTAAYAAYPFISDVPNVRVMMNGSSGVISFKVSDNEAPADQLTLSYTCDNPTLVPADDAHITLGGSGEDRTIVITPVDNLVGQATITIKVTDTDGDSNEDSLTVEVVKGAGY
ncbi:MAG: hypothetical protein WC956_09005 [bacterium]